MTKHMLFATAIAVSIAAMAASSARADLLDDVMAAKKIRIATDLAIPPSGMMDGSMKPVGSDVETAQLLAKDWGLDLEFIQTTGATRIPNVQTNKADIIISTLSVTPERAKVIDFSKPYAALQSVVGCLKTVQVKDWPDLKGKTIAVSRGTTQDTALTNMKDRELTVARFDDDATMVDGCRIRSGGLHGDLRHDREPGRRKEPGASVRVQGPHHRLRSRRRYPQG